MKTLFHCVTVGNPNAGKSTLFNALTGSNQQVGNWAGVTVEKKTGEFTLDQATIKLTDLPGIYDLSSEKEGCDCSLDELIAQEFLSSQKVDAIINLVDASNIERHLYLTTQLRELGIPVIVVLNKFDVAIKRGIKADLKRLSTELGCPVIDVCSRNQSDIEKVKTELQKLLSAENNQQNLTIEYDQEIESSIASMMQENTEINRAQALVLLTKKQSCKDKAFHAETEDFETSVATVRYNFVDKLYHIAVDNAGKQTFTDKLDKIALHPVMGIPVFLFMMYMMFMLSINVGSAFIDFFDITAGALFVDQFGALLSNVGAPAWLITILAGGVGQGIQTVATFIPVIAALFLVLSVLEASGYMARAAFVVDGLMRRIGLPGKAFVPMIVGFGCSVPAIMATRTLGSERERIVTGMMAPFMSCGARLSVYALFAAAFFPHSGQNLVFLLYLLGIAAAVGTGLLLRSTLLPGNSSSAVMELPDYEMPKFKTVMTRTTKRTKSFLFGAGKTIVIVVTFLNFLNAIGTDGSFGNEDSSNSVLSVASQKVTPLFSPLGIEPDNWPATVGIITGIFAKEAVVGTLNNLYSTADNNEEEVSFVESFNEALATIPENLFGIKIEDPLSLSVGEIKDLNAAAEEQGVDESTFSALQKGFVTQSAAFSYLLFVLLYTPCVAAMGALVNEFGAKWARFAALWTFGLAYGSGTVVYQALTFNSHPVQSLCWISGFLITLFVFYRWLKKKGKQAQQIIPGIRIVAE
ncbi:Fe(2+) transporter permease subunit FeoB [Parashewanella spongiae]|uniref:Ferrous iron transport protein B n=1 Tax=Parashewanella spongiae TaxID=342950 RepID=A0A3A6TM44_9GAMM|nr:Fe(2+) transporter permease subunit FeoB [Parashewanella spongiae]MCL1077973.1 Fe(2+) transporter permease subunit FeoB [Parashewanella spongiae]RJY16902.1 Fe(2+) transporter permease subunit FeoB [Parashewanella spongiae]